MDRWLVSGALLLLILECAALVTGIDDLASKTASSSVRTKAIGRVLRTENQVRRRAQRSLVWDDSKTAETVFEYDNVLTLKGSSAQLELNGRSRLHLDENTLVVLEPVSQTSDAELRIRFSRGGLHSRSAHNLQIAGGKKSEPFLLTAYKGADLSLTTIGDQIRVEVKDGHASFEANGQSTAIGGGERLLYKGRSLEKIRLSKDLKWREDQITRVYAQTRPARVPLLWQGEAESVEIVNSGGHHRTETFKSSHDVQLFEGLWHLTLKANDSESASLPIQVRPAPALHLISPLPRDRVRPNDTVLFAWTAGPEVARYRLEIAPSPVFTGPIQKFETESSFTHVSLAEGSYFWRVIGIDADGFEIPPLTAYPLFVTPKPLESPQLLSPEIRDIDVRAPATRKGASLLSLFLPRAYAKEKMREAVFNWSPVTGADHYVIEISKTPAFDHPIIAEKVSQPRFVWKPLPKGSYYWRVAAGNQTQLGLFSTASLTDFSKPNAGSGVKVRTVASIPPQAKPTPPAKTTEDEEFVVPETAPQPEVPRQRAVRKDATSARIAWRPQYRNLNLSASERVESLFSGWVLAHFDGEIFIPDSRNAIWEIRAGYERTSWRPREAPLQTAQTDLRYQFDIYYRPGREAWAYGLSYETLPLVDKKTIESLEVRTTSGVGPAVRYSQTLGADREFDLQLKSRLGAEILGIRLSAALKNFVPISSSRSEIFMGPTGSFGYFSGSDHTNRDLQFGAEFGLSW